MTKATKAEMPEENQGRHERHKPPHRFFTLCAITALVCLVPFVMIISASFSSEKAFMINGFNLLPQTMTAYVLLPNL